MLNTTKIQDRNSDITIRYVNSRSPRHTKTLTVRSQYAARKWQYNNISYTHTLATLIISIRNRSLLTFDLGSTMYLKPSILLILLVTTEGFSASYNKWTDAAGNIHYGDKAPAAYSKSAETIRIHSETKPRATSDSLQKKIEQLDETHVKRQEIKELERLDKAKAAAFAQNCQQSKKQLQTFKEHSRIRVKQKNGSYRMLNHEEKNSQTQKIKDNIKKYCK